jgi:hemolysin activation/secretion protein
MIPLLLTNKELGSSHGTVAGIISIYLRLSMFNLVSLVKIKSSFLSVHTLVLFAVVLSLGTQNAGAQVQPNAASLLRDTQQGTGLFDVQQTSDVTLGSLSGSQTLAPGGEKMLINLVSIEDASVFSEAQLLQVLTEGLGHVPGVRYDMAGLLGLAQTITDHYRTKGYPFASAYLPAQKVSDGTLTIKVLEGQYGSVTTSGLEGVAEPAKIYIKGLSTGKVIEQDTLARTVLILGDMPGVSAVPVLSPGETVGTGDLNIEVAETLGWDGSFELNNHGNHHADDIHWRINLGLNRLATFGDRLSLSLLRAHGKTTLGNISYGFAMGSNGLRGDVSSLRHEYSLRAGFIGFEGHSEAQSLTVSYPIIRSSQTNLLASLKYEQGTMSDAFNSVSYEDKTSRVSALSLQFDHGDTLGGGGLTFGNLTYSHGDIGSTSAAAVQGRFNKLALAISRRQALASGFNLLVHANGQSSAKVLNGSQQITLGGATGIRAYSTDEASGTSGGYLQSELHYGFGAYDAFVLYDVGTILAEGANPKRTLSGYGLGLKVTQGMFQGSVSVAWKGIGGDAQADTLQHNPQVWAEINYSF